MQNITNSKKWQLAGFSIVMFCLFAQLYYYWLTSEFGDIEGHFSAAVAIKNGENEYPANFLLFWLTTFGEKLEQQRWIFVVILAASIVAKFLLTFLALYKLGRVRFYPSVLLAVCFLFVFTLPSLGVLRDIFYLGGFTPNVWHNSTIIFAFPFAMLLFYYGTFHHRKWWLIILLIILNAIIKPSFIFVMVPLWGILSLVALSKNFSLTKEVGRSFLYIVVSLAVLVLQTYMIYVMNKGSLHQEDSGIAFGFFSYYQQGYAVGGFKNIPIALLSGYLFPLTVLALYGNKRGSFLKSFSSKYSVETTALLYAWCVAIFSILIFVFVTETGPRAAHANMYWQIVPAGYILFLSSMVAFLRKRTDTTQGGNVMTNYMIMGAFALHMLMGIFYFYRCLVLLSYD